MQRGIEVEKMSNYYRSSNKNNHYYHSDSSPSSCFGKILNKMHPAARRIMASPLNTAAFPSPPPPISSHHINNNNKSATHFSTPRNQRFGIDDDDNNNFFSDIDDWLEHANKFCKSFNHRHRHHTEPEPEQDLRISALCLRTPEHRRLYNIVLPSVREESPLHLTSNSEEERTTLMHRIKPYDEFLNEIRRKKLEADHARNKAKHLQLMHTLRRKEDAINDWELKQTRKAMDHMDKIQNELERKQIIASVKTQKKIYSVREKAEKQKLNFRRSTMKKFQQLRISETDTHSHSDTSWGLRFL